jgi:Membrane transporters of cations and cationic drugs
MNRAWSMILIAGLLEVAWAICLKNSDGFSNVPYTIAFAVLIALSMLLLSIAIRTLPVGAAYAVWVGIGAVGTFLAGIVLFDDPVNALRVIFVFLIIIGIIGLRLTENKKEKE